MPDGETDGLYYDRELAEAEIDTLMADSDATSLVILGPKNEFSFLYRGETVKSLKVHHGQLIHNLVRGEGAVPAQELSSRSEKSRRTDIKDVNQATVADFITYDSSSHLWKLRVVEKIFVMRFKI